VSIEIETVEAMPPVRRKGSGRVSEDSIRLREAVLTKKVNVIRNVDYKKDYNALQQRIRQAAKAVGLGVRVIISREEDAGVGDVFFEGYDKFV
jgi:hypothetical protein